MISWAQRAAGLVSSQGMKVKKRVNIRQSKDSLLRMKDAVLIMWRQDSLADNLPNTKAEKFTI